MDRGAIEDELRRAGALLVDPSLVRRVIKQHRNIAGLSLSVPHGQSYALPRDALLAIPDAAELGPLARDLPASVILLPRPSSRELAKKTPFEVQTHFARAVFHASVHIALEPLRWTDAAIRERIDRIGQTEFDEVRAILRHDDMLLPPHGDREAYIEFAALYLELRHFALAALPVTFPGLGAYDRIDALLAADLDVTALLAPTRLFGAALPAATTAATAPIERRAPPVVDDVARAAATALALRLESALGPAPEGAPSREQMIAALSELTALAATRARLPLSGASRLLADLDDAARANEDEPRAVDLMTWALSRGKRPIVRDLPATRELFISRGLRSAEQRLRQLAVRPGELGALGDVLRWASSRADANVSAALRPVILEVLHTAGLRPENAPERVAESKLIEELLDQAVVRGYLHLASLRDAISRNQLKLRDLGSPKELVSGDPLLAADARLAIVLDGVYRPGEIYLRLLQKLSSLAFGTPIGRILTMYVLLPFGGAFVLLEGISHVVVAPLVRVLEMGAVDVLNVPSLLVTAAMLFALLHSAPFRKVARVVLKVVGKILGFVFLQIPGWLLSRAIVRRLLRHLPGDVVLDWLGPTWRTLRSQLLPGIFRMVAGLFRFLLDALESAIVRVEHVLRLGRDSSRAAIAVKAGLGLLWFFIAYVVRLYTTLLIEPEINPLKHFPVVTVAHKLLLPFTGELLSAVGPVLAPLGGFLGGTVAATTVFLLPSVFGFLVWELKENRNLYRKSRPTALRPVVVGHHGETFARLLVPGFHSGTLPKLYDRLRRAAQRQQNARGEGAPTDALSRFREGSAMVEEALRRFIEREFLTLIHSPARPAHRWPHGSVHVARISLGSNRVRIGIACPGLSDEPCEIVIDEQSGFLLASIPTAGFLSRLPEGDARTLFENALAGFYHLAGIDLVREQIQATLGKAHYDISDEGLVVWPEETGYRTEVLYPLRGTRFGHFLKPRVRGIPPLAEPRPLDERTILFCHHAIAWSAWVAAWDAAEYATTTLPRLMSGPSLLP